jgi:hypothetical protein
MVTLLVVMAAPDEKELRVWIKPIPARGKGEEFYVP